MTRWFAAWFVCAAGCGGTTIVHQTRYPDGKTHEIFTTQDDKRSGKERVWHPNGAMASEGTYVAGKREGTFVFYNEDRSFDHQVFYLHDEEVWTSRDPKAVPDLPEETRKVSETLASAQRPSPAWIPPPWFSGLDRTTSLNRAGMQYGVGGPGTLAFGSARRFDVFGNYMHRDVGGYGQFSTASLETMSGVTLSGRQTLELGATYRLPSTRLGLGTARLGVLAPVAHNDGNGFLATTAADFQRPSDAVSSVPSSLAIRTSTSLTRSMNRLVVQADAGIDWMLGGEPAALDALARLNLGLGFGSRAAVLQVELTNTLSISHVDRRLHGVGFGGGVGVVGVWLSGMVTYCVSNDVAITAAVGYAL
jgi:hypothetical protein